MTFISKAIVLIMLGFIFFSLGSALYYLVREKRGDSTRIVKALTWRITLSILLFILLFIAFAMGWLHPHPVGG